MDSPSKTVRDVLLALTERVQVQARSLPELLLPVHRPS
jgi:hypothetical protein